MTPKSFRCRLTLLVLAAQTIAGLAQKSPTSPQTANDPKPTPAAAQVRYGKLPLTFEPNLGQTDSQVQWLARGPEYTLFLAGHDAVLELNAITPAGKSATGQAATSAKITSSAVRMNLLGAQPVERAAGEDAQPGKSNYFTGRDSSKWQKNVPNYGKVRLNSVYPGVDLVYYGHQGQLEYDFVVAPGADPSAIRWGFDGAKPAIAANGDLLLPINGTDREVHLNKPVVYQMKDGVREPVESSFTIAGNKAGFKIGAYDKSRELVIDPTLVFMGALGTGNQQSLPNGMALNAENEMIITGITNDLNFPTTSGSYEPACQTPNGNGQANRCGASSGSSAFVTKISADGTKLVYSTYLHGGYGYEAGQSVAVDSSGNAVIFGQTSSEDFPVTGDAYQSICMPYYTGSQNGIQQNCDGNFAGGGTEWVIGGPTLFIAKLSPDGSKIVYGTFFGGTAQVYPVAMALDSSDNIYFVGYDQGAWATANVYPNNGNQNVQFPLTNSAFQSSLQGQQVATLSVLSADGHTLLYSSFLGAVTGTDWVSAAALAVGQNGLAAVGGFTSSAKLPTTPNSVRPACVPNPNNSGDCYDYTAFTTVFDTTQSGASSIVYSTYIGGDETQGSNIAQNGVEGLAFDSSNDLFITGYTQLNNLPVTKGAFQTHCEPLTDTRGCWSSFLTKLDPTGSTYLFSTYFGGTNNTSSTTGNSILFDPRGWVYLYGYNSGYGWDLPVVNPIAPLNGSSFAFVAAFSSDGKKLLLSTPVFESPNVNYAANAIATSGFALDSENNFYVVGYGGDGGNLQPTNGTYSTVATSSFNRTYFAKLTKLLGPVNTKLTITPAPALPGSSITFTVGIIPTAETTPTPTGTVTVTNANTTPPTVLGTITLAKGTGSFTTSKLARGSYSVVATYNGDANYQTQASTAATLAVNQFTPTVKVTPGELTIAANKPLSVTVDLTGPTGSPAPAGTVTLSSGSYTSASVTLAAGIAKFIIPAGKLAGGRIELLCKYTPNAIGLKTYLTATGHIFETVTKVTQTLKFTAPKTPIVYGAKPIALVASATSGLPIVFKIVSGPGKIVGKTLEVTGGGTIVVEATQPGNSDYDAAVAIKHSVLVEKAKLTVTANNLTMKQGAKVPTLTYKMAGFVNGNTQSATVHGQPKLATTATSASASKSYPITITLGTLNSLDYTFTFKAGTLTVTQ